MKNKLLCFLVFLSFLLCLTSCTKKSENEFFIESIDILEKKGWIKEENKYTMKQETEFIKNYCHIFDETFEIEELKDYALLTAPDRLQTKENYSYNISFIVFASNEDAQTYFNLIKNKGYTIGVYMAINDNIFIETNSEEPVSLLPVEFYLF
jgi:hypothetical protein